jgi:hypothetical protein
MAWPSMVLSFLLEVLKAPLDLILKCGLEISEPLTQIIDFYPKNGEDYQD